MKKLFNYRPLVSIALFLMAGIIFAVNLYGGSTFGIIVSVLMILSLIVTFAFKLFLVKDHKIFKLVSIVVAFLVGALGSVITFEIYFSRPYVEGEHFVAGRVAERSYRSDSGKIVVTVDDVTAVDLQSLNKIEMFGKLRIYLTEDDANALDLKLGDKVNVVANLSRIDPFSANYSGFKFLTQNIFAIGFGDETDIVNTGESDPTIFDRFKTRVKTILDDNMSEDYSELGYTMLFGDRAGLDGSFTESYYASGIGHLLAVSGLHVGFVVTLLSLLLSLFKANNKVKFVVISIVIFLYAFMCGFSVSVTRAFIMTVVLLYSRAQLRENDSLSALAMAAIIILLFSPLQLFTLGFKLSFGAVLGILLLNKPIKAILDKFLFDRLSSAISISLSASIGIMPFVAYELRNLSLFSIVTNVIVIPIASLAFMILLPVVLVALLIKFVGVLSYAFEFLMRIVTGISKLTGAISLAAASEWLLLGFGICVILMCIIASDYLFLKRKTKVISLSVLSIGTLGFFVTALIL